MAQQQLTDTDAGRAWLTQKLDGYHFHDARPARRFRELAARLWDRLGESISMVCQDWANTKAAYRGFLEPGCT